jgi:hypothetical protein
MCFIRGLIVYIYFASIVVCYVDYEPHDDDLVRVETYLGVEE